MPKLSIDLMTLKLSLEVVPHWREVLAVFAPLRLATAGHIISDTGLSRRRVEAALRSMMSLVGTDGAFVVRELGSYQLGVVLARPSKVYELGTLGAALLQEMGLVRDVVSNGISEQGAVRHRLTLLTVYQVLVDRGYIADVERVFAVEQPAGDDAEHKTVRADVAVQVDETHWRMVEIEQDAPDRTHARRVKRLESLARFFALGGEAQVEPNILVVFYVKDEDYKETVYAWRLALSEVLEQHPRLGFRLFPVNWTDWEQDGFDLPLTLADADELEPVAESEFEQWRKGQNKTQHEAKKQALEKRRSQAVEMWWQLNRVDQMSDQADVVGLLATAWDIYAASRVGALLTWRHVLGAPVQSLKAYQQWLLERPGLRSLMIMQLKQIRPSASGWQLAGPYDRVLWSTLLRHFGVHPYLADGRGHLQVLARPNRVEREVHEAGVGYGGLHVDVTLSGDLWLACRGEVMAQVKHPLPVAAGLEVAAQTQEQLIYMERALSWFLSAPATYSTALGLPFNDLSVREDEPEQSGSPFAPGGMYDV